MSDDDLDEMGREELAAEVRRLRAAIRAHRDASGHELCWHQPSLWGVLPERTDPLPAVPDWPQFLRGCIRYRQSLDAQLSAAPRTAEEFGDEPATTPSVENPVGWFEIPVTDLERAVRFYETVFGMPLERSAVDGHEMALFPFDPSGRGVSGALARGESYVPGHQGTRVYFRSSALEDTLRRAVKAGGRVLYPRTAIGTLGWVAEFEDSEGNVVALHDEQP